MVALTVLLLFWALGGHVESAVLGGVFTLGNGPVQTLQGNGLLLGDLTVGALGRVAPGFSIGTLQVLNNINLGGSNIMEINVTNVPNADQLVAQNGTLTYGGALVVSDLAPSGATNGTYVFQLFNAPTITGSFTSTNLPALPATKTWDTSELGAGRIKLVVNVNTTPTNITASVSGNTLQLSWPPDHIGWRLQVQTNSESLAPATEHLADAQFGRSLGLLGFSGVRSDCERVATVTKRSHGAAPPSPNGRTAQRHRHQTAVRRRATVTKRPCGAAPPSPNGRMHSTIDLVQASRDRYACE